MNQIIARACLAAILLAFVPAFGQIARGNPQSREARITEGTVASASAVTLVVRAENGEHVLFARDDDTVGPRAIATGARVRVTSSTDEEGLQVARAIEILAEPAPGGAQATEPVIPPEVRRAERQIERQARRYRAGVRAGVGLDPEIVSVGAHARVGPFFHRDVWLRPNVEFGFGEVTTLFALNLEAVYRLPITPRQGRWSVYVGAGPGLNLIDRDFEAAERGEREIDFDDFDYETSLNLLAGVEFRSGMFLELKSTAYSRPNVKLLVGYSF